jgi:MoxR-like ATPase
VISLLRSAQAWAFLHGPRRRAAGDLQAVLPAVVGHRLRRATPHGHAATEVGRSLIGSVPIP